MTTRLRSRLLTILLLLAAAPAPAEQAYRQVSATGLLQGYAKTGEAIEVEGHAWQTRTAFLIFN